MATCIKCDNTFPDARWELGYETCLACGEAQARKVQHTIVPIAKSNYQPITNLEILKQLNKYAN